MKKLLLAAALLPILVACGGGAKSIDGKWNVSEMKGMPPGTKPTMTFSGGKDMSMDLAIDQDVAGKKVKINMVISGTYELKGDMITITAKDAKFDVQADDKAVKDMMQAGMEGQKKTIIDEINKKSGANKVKWVDDNNIELQASDGVQKLTRA